MEKPDQLTRFPNYIGHDPIIWKWIHQWDSDTWLHDCDEAFAPALSTITMTMQTVAGQGYYVQEKDTGMSSSVAYSRHYVMKFPKNPYDGDVWAITTISKITSGGYSGSSFG